AVAAHPLSDDMELECPEFGQYDVGHASLFRPRWGGPGAGNRGLDAGQRDHADAVSDRRAQVLKIGGAGFGFADDEDHQDTENDSQDRDDHGDGSEDA